MAQLHSQLFVCSLVLPASAASLAGRSFSQTNSVSLCFRQQFQYSSISAPLPHSPRVDWFPPHWPPAAHEAPTSRHNELSCTSASPTILLLRTRCTQPTPGRLLLFLFAASVCPSNTDSLRIFYLRILDFLLHPMFDEGYFKYKKIPHLMACRKNVYSTLESANCKELSILVNFDFPLHTWINGLAFLSIVHLRNTLLLGAILQWVLGTGRPYPRSL